MYLGKPFNKTASDRRKTRVEPIITIVSRTALEADLQADHRLPYGKDPSQFGELWLPRVRRAFSKQP
jgi:hypothetical protein